MSRFILKSVLSTIITMLLVSVGLFFLVEIGSGDIATKVLGIFSTPEQRASYRLQLGLDEPAWLRYLDWLMGNDWRVDSRLPGDPVLLANPENGDLEWWVRLSSAQAPPQLARWRMTDGILERLVRAENGRTVAEPETLPWSGDENDNPVFWGIDTRNNAVMWARDQATGPAWVFSQDGVKAQSGGAQRYIPLRKGLLRGDAGTSLQYNRPVANLIWPRIRNTIILGATAFLIMMPLGLVLGILAGVNEGRLPDRIISIAGLGITAIPEFVTGIFLILVFGIWLKLVPAVALFTTSDAVLQNPKMLILPVLTLTAIELGYVARMTRASMVEVMATAYIRTAFAKGMPKWRVVLRHAVRNALMAPITVIMLHVNWLVGGVVVTEVIFGYPGLGKFIYDAAIFGDFNAIEAAAMVTVGIAIGTRLIGDLAYTLLNPRIRYA